jgi:hypothetical protein
VRASSSPVSVLDSLRRGFSENNAYLQEAHIEVAAFDVKSIHGDSQGARVTGVLFQISRPSRVADRRRSRDVRGRSEGP